MTREINVDVEHLVEMERRKFEQYARKNIRFANLQRDKRGRYERKSMEDCWQCWLAALQLV